MSETTIRTPVRVRSTDAIAPQISPESANELMNLVSKPAKSRRVTANVVPVQNPDGTVSLQVDNIKKKKSLSDRTVTTLRATEAGETLAALGSVAFGIYSALTGNVAAGYPAIAGGAGVLWKLAESKIIDWMKK
ncbi:MAG: hypothetical protein LBE98_03940 [Puniceicoccales bacterium]|jgi:hypothetical protein|nr:hypothetical protein [Puniceicoccales bacterium]